MLKFSVNLFIKYKFELHAIIISQFIFGSIKAATLCLPRM